jgi:mono/diheme cytochrome c family protein
MIREQRSEKSAIFALAVAVLAVAVLALAVPVAAQQPPTSPFAPEWGMLAGFEVFAKKGCGQCHGLRGSRGGPGPDLARIETGKSFFELGAAMWNHLPRMGARMREARIERPTLTPRELSDLIAFLFTAQYYDEQGDAAAGQEVFRAKGCIRCHVVGSTGVGITLDTMKSANSPVLVAAAMWNHGPEMAETMKDKGIPRPKFEGREMVDLIAYVVGAAKDQGAETAQVIPGTPERGQKLFSEKRCVVCHAVGGKGGKVGPDLGRSGHHVSLTRLAALMWNHGPTMWGLMKERGIEVPRLSGQEMADILAYLYTSHYFDRTASAERGQRVLQAKGCLGCHALRGQGGKISADFATSNVVGSPASVIAAMWNHSAWMEDKAQQRNVSWPILSGQELADLTAYLNTLARSRPKPK